MKTITKSIVTRVEEFEGGDVVDVSGFGRYMFVYVPTETSWGYMLCNLATGNSLASEVWKTAETANLDNVKGVTDWIHVGNIKDHLTDPFPFSFDDI